MKHVFRLLPALLLFTFAALAQTGRVGVGTTSPRAGLDVSSDDGIVATGTIGSGNTNNLPTGRGARLLLIPRKAAFRAGSVNSDEWDFANIGEFSMAIGTNTLANNDFSMAFGFNASATGNRSMTLGTDITASGTRSTAIGHYVSTNGQQGSLIIGDGTLISAATTSSATNQFTARFLGGYQLFTAVNLTTGVGTVGVQVAAGGNSWSTISDSTRKENFRPIDGASFLRKIAGMRLVSWNYRGQDPRTFRHYGPMAQDFFAAFGKDELGTIGEDTSINQADFDGVNLIAIKALIAEVEQLKAENRRMHEQNTALRADVDWIKKQLTAAAGK